MVSNKMDKKKLNAKIRHILIPAILENAFLILSDMILTGYIGRLTISEISSYGISTRIYGIYFSILKGFGIGAMVIFARTFGSKNKEKGLLYYKLALIISFSIALIAAIGIYLYPSKLLSTMSTNSKLLVYGTSFLKIHALTYPFIAIIHLNSAIFQADGNTKTPLYIATIGNVISVILGYILILGFGPIKGFGLYGAAITNNVRIILMMTIGLYLLFGKNGMFDKVKIQKFVFNNDMVKDILKFSIPTAIGNSFWNFASVFLSTFILTYGEKYYAAYQIGLQAEGFCDMMASGFLTASMALASQSIGANNETMYKSAYQRLNFYCLIISAINMLFLLLFSKQVLYLLTNKEQLVTIAHTYLLLMIFSQFPEMKSKILYGYIRSAGSSTLPTIIDTIGIWGVRVFLSYLISMIFNLDIVWIWWIINADQWVRYLLSLSVFVFRHLINYLSAPSHIIAKCNN